MENTQVHLNGNGDIQQTLVVIFLRGGADGLSLVAPVEDDDYQKARPRIALTKKDAIRLNGFYGLNPNLSALEPIYKDGALAIVHCAGSEDDTRSHFEAQDLMEHGGLAAGGWLGRFLRSRNTSSGGALSAVAVGNKLPECLRGAPSAAVMQSIDEFSLGADTASLVRSLEQLYATQRDGLGSAARDTVAALRRVDSLRKAPYRAANGAIYATDGFASGLKEIARLIKARVGLEAVSIDLGGWDSHFTQGTVIDPLMNRLSKGLAAFYTDLGALMSSTTVVVMTEFGRRVHENASFGTDHGRGSVMFAIGGGIHGGRIVGKWPGLKSDTLEGPGDLPVINNYRNVLAPILARHGAADKLPLVFPDFKIAPLDLYG